MEAPYSFAQKIVDMIYGAVIGAAALAAISALFFGCESPESFHLQLLPPECSNEDGDWYFVDCESGHGSICTNENGSISGSDCIYSKYGTRYYCVEECK